VGGHRHHRGAHRALASRRPVRQGGGSEGPMRQQPEAARTRPQQLREREPCFPLCPWRLLRPPAPWYGRWSAHAMILSQMEQSTVFNAINFALCPALPNMGVDMMGNVILPVLNVPDNTTATQTRIGTFTCPSDYTLNNWPGTNGYVVNQGGWMYDSTSNTGSVGPFSDCSAVTVAAITDGMSQTAFASERLLGSGIMNQDLSGWYMYMQMPMP